MSLKALCRFTAKIERKVTADPSAANKGGQVVSWNTTYDSHDWVCSRPQQHSGRISTGQGARQIEVSHTIYTPSIVTIEVGDRITFASEFYLVQWIRDMGGQNRARALYCLKID